MDPKKLQVTIEDCLLRNLTILVQDRGSGAPETAKDGLMITVREVRDMLRAAAANLAVALSEMHMNGDELEELEGDASLRARGK